jgi:hypothetical protein
MRYLSWNLVRVLTLTSCVAGSVGACAIADDDNNATNASELVIKDTVTFTLSATSSDEPIAVTLPDNSSYVYNPCSVSFPSGTTTYLHPIAHDDKTNCLQFKSWAGACAGQSSQCELVMNSDMSTSIHWVILISCF